MARTRSVSTHRGNCSWRSTTRKQTSPAARSAPITSTATPDCTSTAAEALKESFGCDGQPGSYTDIDHADAIALFGHNVAETQTVLWMRILDRLAGPSPPALLCVDPRLTAVAQHATVHLA